MLLLGDRIRGIGSGWQGQGHWFWVAGSELLDLGAVSEELDVGCARA